MGGISEDSIRKRAYHIWEREGRPQGRDFEHWVQAQVELTAEAAGNGGREKPSSAKVRASAPKGSPKERSAAPRTSRTRKA